MVLTEKQVVDLLQESFIGKEAFRKKQVPTVDELLDWKIKIKNEPLEIQVKEHRAINFLLDVYTADTKTTSH